MPRKRISYWLLAGIVIAVILLCTQPEAQEPPATLRDYPEIKQSGILRAVTEYNAISYHVSGDTIQGFDYELLHAFAKEKGLQLEIIPEMSFDKRLQMISDGKCDILATGTIITTRSKHSLLFTHTLQLSKQVLVQRKKEEGKERVDAYGDEAQYRTPLENPFVLELLERLGYDSVENFLENSKILTRDFGE